ncbi:MAG TPA: SDR family oxidoreductase [Dehalococcoidia bacterium]|nr:SDR family oxidoreductase [Dehalococcoidia bacterium]
MRLAGKAALVTGANKHIGGTIAAFLAREGARVACNDISTPVAEATAWHIRSRGGEAIALPGDVSDAAQVDLMVGRAVEVFDGVDILVNNAGGLQYRGGVLEAALEEWNRQLAVFLTGTMLMTQAVARALVARGRPGSIINILSTAAHQGQPDNLGYCTVKGGLLNFTRAAAMDLAHHNIRVNAITPTAMEFNPTRPLPSATPAAERTRTTVNRDDFIRGIPMGRLPRTPDIANAAVFLASDEAAMITGADLRVDGGALARYWPWTPGAADNLTWEEYARSTVQHLEWGEET